MACASRRGATAACLVVALALATSPGGAVADVVFSPGPLALGHAQLEGLTHCTDCHALGKQLTPERCLACHVELKDRVARGEGLHGRMPPGERLCQSCHHEHQGREFALIDWGDGGRDRFDHARTGWPLRGKHAVKCERCHERRLIADPDVTALLGKRPSRQTLLGAPRTCAACHFDEHRGQIGTECQWCHLEEAWKPASRGFNHARTRYPLRDKHAAVTCAKCHPRLPDESTPDDAFPAPLARTYTTMKPIAHGRCLDCHKDPHQGRFGESCESCHGVKGWRVLTGRAKEFAFHQKTRYPLEGAHVSVGCKACHGPFGREKARYRGIPFRACADCHADAHVAQLARPRGGAACERCHGVQGWSPARYDVDEHEKAAYRLEAAHRAVACALCHTRDERLAQKVPPAVRSDLEHRRRPVRVSLTRVAPLPAERCETCHRDPHGGQFPAGPQPPAGGPCAACHALSGWRDLRFDHGRGSRFPLTGKHAQAPCATCHETVAGVTRYRPLEHACASCHPDAHAAQFAPARAAPTDCGRCHDATSWKAPFFVHAPPATPFRLEGKHAPLKCDACHKPVVVASGVEVKRYRPLPRECEGCHADFHRGAFRGFAP